MALLMAASAVAAPSHTFSRKVDIRGKQMFSHSLSLSGDIFLRRRSSTERNLRRSGVRTAASFCLFNPNQQPILKEALKEPVAFLGGMFAGLLRLDLNEEPLKEWVTRTVEASGISEEEIVSGDVQEDDVPQEIQIE